MQNRLYFTVLTVALLALFCQSAAAQDACTDAIVANMDNSAALERAGLSTHSARYISQMHRTMERTQTQLAEMQRTLDNLELVDLALAKQPAARKALGKTRDKIMANMKMLTENMNSSSEALTAFATRRCQGGEENDRRYRHH